MQKDLGVDIIQGSVLVDNKDDKNYTLVIEGFHKHV